jgi:hypothetical protein
VESIILVGEPTRNLSRWPRETAVVVNDALSRNRLDRCFGRVAEWFKAPVLKTSLSQSATLRTVPKGSVSLGFARPAGFSGIAQSHPVLRRPVAIGWQT